MVHFEKISKPRPTYSIFQYVSGIATPRPFAKKLSQRLVNNIDNGGRGLVSEFVWGIVALISLNIWRKNWLRLGERITYIYQFVN